MVDSLAALRSELLRLRRGLVEVAAEDNIGIAAAGTAPSSAFADFELTSTGRYGRMQEQYRLLVDEQLICGLQIHVGVSDRDLAVQIMQRVARDLPILLALSASSPFWNEQDTGYASIRSIIWQRWPSAGATGRLRVGRRVRPAARRPDQHRRDRRREDGLLRRPPVLPRTHPGAAHLRRLPDRRRRRPDRRPVPRRWSAPPNTTSRPAGPFDPVPPPVHRAAIWQAARGGLSGELLDDTRHPRPLPAARRGPSAGRAAHAPAGGARRLGRGQRAGRDDPGPRQLRRPAAGRVRRAGPAHRRCRARGQRDPRSGRGTEPADAPVLRRTGSGPATRPSGPAVGPGRSIAISSSTTAAPARRARAAAASAPRRLGRAARA